MSTDLKAQARRLAAALNRAGHRVNHTTALHLIAQQHGFENWHALLAAQAAAPTPAQTPVRIMLDLSGGTWGEIIADAPVEVLLLDDDFTEGELDDRDGELLLLGNSEFIYSYSDADVNPERIERIFAALNADSGETSPAEGDSAAAPAAPQDHGDALTLPERRIDVYATANLHEDPLGSVILPLFRADPTRPWVARLPSTPDAPWPQAHAGRFYRVGSPHRSDIALTQPASRDDIPAFLFTDPVDHWGAQVEQGILTGTHDPDKS